jgi:hypothetical protein
MLNETWTEQYDRMQRSFELLKQIGEQSLHPQDMLWAPDVLYHFCSDALHLRDWIAATLGTDENSTKALAQQITDEVIQRSPELSACCDIANGFKHLVLHRRSYVTGMNQGHAKVVSREINFATMIRIEDEASGTATVVHPDGTIETDVPLEPEWSPPADSDVGWIQDIFKIDINGQEHDAQDVATKAVAAWDQWLRGGSSLAAQLR